MADALDFTFRVGEYTGDELRVLRFSGTEGLSAPYQFDLELIAQGIDPDFEEMIGADACLAYSTPEGERYVHGVIMRWEETGRGKSWTNFEATVVPHLWTLGLRRQSRIFQAQSTQAIVKAVLEQAGIASDRFRFSLQGSYAARTYCVQYRESDLAFMNRLLEEEGIFYFFEATEDGEILVMTDSADGSVPIDGEATLAFREGDPGLQGGEQVTSFHAARSLALGAFSLKDFDFKKPSLALESAAAGEGADKEQGFFAEDYPGEYPNAGIGDRLAKVRLEEARAERLLAIGETDCRRLAPGYRFTLADHLREELNQEYLLVGVRHRGVQPQGGIGLQLDDDIYACTFECIPATTPYRAPRLTPRPAIEGLQTAIVVGPAGEEIHCDEFGRVKVKFHWDLTGTRDDKASCWIRVSQHWGGGGWGSMYIPRVGQEVVIQFLEGDPDRPVIMGRIYNGESLPPYELPARKTKSSIQSSTTPGGASVNELRMEDSKGNEELFINASKDHNIQVLNNRTDRVEVTERETVGGNRTREVQVDEKAEVIKNRNETVVGDQKLTVKGDETVQVAGSFERTIGGQRMRLVIGDSTVSVDGQNTKTVGTIAMHLVKGESKREAGGNASTTVGAAVLEAVKGDHTEEAEGNWSRTVGGLIFRKLNGDISQESEGGFSLTCPLIKVNAEDVEIESDSIISLVAGGSTVVLTSSGVTVESSGITVKASGTLTQKGSMLPWN